MKNSLSTIAKRAVELATENEGIIKMADCDSLKELDNKLNKKEFRDAIKLLYDWEITDTPMICACGVQFGVVTQWCVSAAVSLSSVIANCATWKQRC